MSDFFAKQKIQRASCLPKDIEAQNAFFAQFCLDLQTISEQSEPQSIQTIQNFGFPSLTRIADHQLEILIQQTSLGQTFKTKLSDYLTISFEQNQEDDDKQLLMPEINNPKFITFIRNINFNK